MTISHRDLPHPLSDWAEQVDRLQWSALITDPDWTLRWTSRSLRTFLRVDDGVDLGYGLHLAQAWTSHQEWLHSATPDSQIHLFNEMAPLIVAAMQEHGQDAEELLAEPFASLLGQIETAPTVPLLWSSSFEYRDPQDEDLPPYRVNFVGIRMNGDDGAPVGLLLIFFMDVNPNLMSLLVRGDQEMYNRMARLVDPQPQEGAILFCDLHESGRLSRELSSASYFKLVRRLWTGTDAAIAEECGIVGKHAGDGASAFFLAEDLGSPSGTAAAALRCARRIHETSSKVSEDTVGSGCMMKIGLHWGGALYMGQLVPGGRLDVTALGDEVNEASRVQETAAHGKTLVSKQLLERLELTDAAAVGIDLETPRFKLLSEVATASEKARRDAGSLAVCEVE